MIAQLPIEAAPRPMLKCARGLCPRGFLPRRWWHRYCCDSCRARDYQARRGYWPYCLYGTREGEGRAIA